MDMPLHELSVAEAGAALRDGSLTSARLTEYTLERIAAIDPLIDSLVSVTAERAITDAERADEELSRDIDRGPLHGIPYTLKDIIDTAGIETTSNSRLMLGHVPDQDAFVEGRLRSGGGVLVGKANLAEFAFGGPGFDLPTPPARNPWNPERFTGGSSAGSGACVAAGLVRISIGSDTGGSIRSPAANCGVVGFKPTYGLVSRRGVFPLSYTLDHVGPTAWSVRDAALAMNVITGHDPLDPGSVERRPEDYTADLGKGVEGLRIGYAREFFTASKGVSGEVVDTIDAAAARLASLGAMVEEVSMPDFELMKACGRVILQAEGYAIHERNLRERPRDYGRYTYQRLTGGAGLTAADYIQATRVRHELTRQLNSGLFQRYDALITTVALAAPAPFTEFPHDWPPPSLAVAVQTAPFNVTGHPALAMPAGFSSEGLPFGLQIIGRYFDERGVLRIAQAFESAAGVTPRRPGLGAEIRI
ncbi:amidase [Streptacidiphilus sp. P02-A3a]|uniref:amidase n=1 Tax=Streptacidiphilus sp. P02-A3a TaxID=2704468 RepID=UPI0015FA3416|nr:amidase [Streptacidiphilus sp. P02-A3a]QMU71835.1 amidase [Streptacidiphilus sp. P02-A3a]